MIRDIWWYFMANMTIDDVIFVASLGLLGFFMGSAAALAVCNVKKIGMDSVKKYLRWSVWPGLGLLWFYHYGTLTSDVILKIGIGAALLFLLRGFCYYYGRFKWNI